MNPRCTFRHIRDFQSRSLDHSDTPPCGPEGSRARNGWNRLAGSASGSASQRARPWRRCSAASAGGSGQAQPRGSGWCSSSRWSGWRATRSSTARISGSSGRSACSACRERCCRPRRPARMCLRSPISQAGIRPGDRDRVPPGTRPLSGCALVSQVPFRNPRRPARGCPKRPPNVEGTVFKTQEAAYLAGYLAAKMESKRPRPHS